MKKILLPVAILSSILLFPQELIKKYIISINTYEKNAKTILFEKQILDNSISFVLKAENKSSKDFAKCKWITSLSKEELMYFIDALEALEVGSSLESSLFNFVYKKNKIKIQIKDTKCTSEHKMYYFQKSCNRMLSFVILPNEVPNMLSTLKQTIREIEYVSK
ncbi:MAG: hypothetical protein VX762_00165 [Bacteroidota bacterium]|nr:hypothetical protein [Bacteroidota bacterium]